MNGALPDNLIRVSITRAGKRCIVRWQNPWTLKSIGANMHKLSPPNSWDNSMKFQFYSLIPNACTTIIFQYLQYSYMYCTRVSWR